MRASITVSLLLSILLIGCQNNEEKKPAEQTTKESKITTVLYTGGDIITMDGNALEMAEAIVTQDNEIVFVGSKERAKEGFPDSKIHDLKGNTLMPGFVEPHVHPSLAATMLPRDGEPNSTLKLNVSFQSSTAVGVC